MSIAHRAVGIETFVALDEPDDRRDQLPRVFNRSGDALYGFILVRVGGDRHAADDLVQQVCHEMARRRKLPPHDGEWEAWMRGIARNLIRRHWRRWSRHRNEVSIENPRLARQLAEDLESRPLPADALVSEELHQQLLLAVTSLSAEDQRLVFAFYFDGRSQAEIADDLGTSVKSVEMKMYRVRNCLRSILRKIERT